MPSLGRARLLVWTGVVLALGIAKLPALLYGTWSPRVAALLLIAPLGLACMVRRMRHSDAPAWWAAGFCAVAVLAGAMSAEPWSSLIGYPGVSLSAFTVVLIAAAWSFSRDLPVSDLPAAERVVASVLLAHVAWAVVQLVVDGADPSFGLVFGRPTGFLVNPVFFGGVVAGGVALATVRAARSSSLGWSVTAGVMSFGVTISGSRAAFVSALAVVAVVCWRERRAKPVVPLVAVVLGAVIGQIVGSLTADRVSIGDRLAIGADSDGRSAVWRYAWSALLERPFAGWGFGMFRASIQGRVDDDFVRAYAGTGQRWDDPHNIVVNVAVSTGLLGLVVAVGLVVVSCRRARGPLAWCSVAIALTWLLQPASILTVPFAALALGASMADRDGAVRPERRRPSVDVVAIAVGVVAAIGLLTLDARAQRQWAEGDAESLAATVGPWWPDPSTALEAGNRMFFAALDDPTLADRAIELSARPTEMQPHDPQWWGYLAYRQIVFERFDDAEASLDRALALQPNDANAWKLTSLLAEATGDERRAEEAAARACSLDPALCDGDTEGE